MAALRTPRRVLFASDFSGLDSAWLALQRLKVPAKLQFCSDNNPNCKALLNALHCPCKFFDDVTDRQPEEELESDVFVFTPPCQPYSSLGKKKGAGDKKSDAMKSSFQYIKRRRPRLVVFENVRGLTFKKFRPVHPRCLEKARLCFMAEGAGCCPVQGASNPAKGFHCRHSKRFFSATFQMAETSW